MKWQASTMCFGKRIGKKIGVFQKQGSIGASCRRAMHAPTRFKTTKINNCRGGHWPSVTANLSAQFEHAKKTIRFSILKRVVSIIVDLVYWD